MKYMEFIGPDSTEIGGEQAEQPRSRTTNIGLVCAESPSRHVNVRKDVTFSLVASPPLVDKWSLRPQNAGSDKRTVAMPTLEPDTTSAAPVGLASPANVGPAGKAAGKHFLPALADIIFICTSLGVLLTLQGSLLGEDGDAAWNLRIGSYILAHGLPRTEFMHSTTLGKPTIYFEWLAQVVYGLALRLGGLNGVVALVALFVGLELALLITALRRRGVPLPLAFILTVAGAWLTTNTWTARAQQFSVLLTLAWSELLWQYWRTGDRRLLWIFPVSAALWANLHGGFVGGLLMLGVAVIVAWVFPGQSGRANPRALSLTFIAAAAATLLNPWGVGLWVHIAEYLRNPVIMANTIEYLSPNFHTSYGQAFLVLLVALVASWIVMAAASQRPTQGEQGETTVDGTGAFSPLALALGALWTLLALDSVRFVALWALVMIPILGAAITACLRARDWERLARHNSLVSASIHVFTALNRRLDAMAAVDRRAVHGLWGMLGVVATLVLVLNGGALPGSRAAILDAQFDAHTFPVAAAKRLSQDGLPSGNGFTTYTWGSYLDYALPAYHPLVDSRTDVESARLLQQYLDIVGIAPDWSTLLDQYHIVWALLPVNAPLVQVLALRPGWTCQAADNVRVAVLCQDSSP
jgi:hypothetical protein